MAAREPFPSALLAQSLTTARHRLPLPALRLAAPSATTVTTATDHGLAVGDDVIIAGSVNYNGRWAVASAATTTTFTINKVYVAETVSTDPPVTQKCHFKAPGTIPLKRLGTFSAKFYKDGAEYKCAQDVTIDIDMDLDGEQRCLGDNGFRSQLLEGIAAITANLTVAFRNGTFFRDGQNNTTAALKLEFTAAYGIGKLTIDLPKNQGADGRRTRRISARHHAERQCHCVYRKPRG